jgi:hypothetical protein
MKTTYPVLKPISSIEASIRSPNFSFSNLEDSEGSETVAEKLRVVVVQGDVVC